MNVSLTPEMEQFINQKVETGIYHTSSEVVGEALRLLQQRDESDIQALRDQVMAGFADIESGDFEEYDEQTTKQLAEDIKRRGRTRLASATTHVE